MFQGSMPALVTPFKNGSVDVDALKSLVDQGAGPGVNAPVELGEQRPVVVDGLP